MEGELIDVYLSDLHQIPSLKYSNAYIVIINNQHCLSCNKESISALKVDLKKEKKNKKNIIAIFSKNDSNYVKSVFREIPVDTFFFDSINLEKYGLEKMYPIKFTFKNGQLVSKKRYFIN